MTYQILFIPIFKLYMICKQIVFRQWPGRAGFNPRSSHTKDSKKWYLILSCLTLSIIRYISKVKWSNQGKGVAPSLIPRCRGHQKGSLRFNLGSTIPGQSRPESNGNKGLLHFPKTLRQEPQHQTQFNVILRTPLIANLLVCQKLD